MCFLRLSLALSLKRRASSPYGPELVTAGDGSATTGWSIVFGGGAPSVSAVGGRLRVNSDNASGAIASQTVTVQSGATYRFLVDQINGTGTGQVTVGSTSGAADYFNNSATNGAGQSGQFVATGTSAFISLYNYGSVGTYCEYDNISLKKVL